MIPDRIFPGEDTRPTKKAHTEPKPLNSVLSCLTLEMLAKIQESTTENFSSFTSSCKALHDLMGYDRFWLTFCNKVGLLPKVTQAITDVDTHQPLTEEQIHRLAKVTLSKTPTHQLSVYAPYRNTFFDHVALVPLNHFKFQLLKLKLREKEEESEYVEETSTEAFENLVQAYLVNNFVGRIEIDASTKQYAASKFLQHFLNSEDHQENQNADDTRVDLVFDYSDFYLNNYAAVCPNDLEREFYSESFQDDNAYEWMFDVKSKLIDNDRKDLAARADLFMGKALYYLEAPTQEQINQAHNLFHSVQNDTNATKGDKRAAQFYSLMLCFRANGQPEAVTDEILAKKLLELNLDKKLTTPQRNWVQARLVVMCYEERTNLVSKEQALSLCKQIHRSCADDEATNSLIYDIANIYGALLAIKCDTFIRDFARDSAVFPTYNEKLLKLNQYASFMQILQGHIFLLPIKKDAAAELTVLKENSVFSDQEKKFAAIAILEYEKNESFWKDSEAILKHADGIKDINILRNISPSLMRDREFPHRLVDTNPESLEILKTAFDKDDSFMYTVMERNLKLLASATPEQKNDVNFLLTRLETIFLAVRYSSKELHQDETFLENFIVAVSLSLPSANSSLSDEDIEKISRKYADISRYTIDLAIEKHIRVDNKKFLLSLLSREFLLSNWLSFIPEQHLDDLEFISDIVKINPYYFSLAGPTIKDNAEFVSKYLDENKELLQRHAPEFCIEFFINLGPIVRDNEEIISKLVDINPNFFLHASDRLKNKFEFALQMLKKNPIIREMVSPEIQNNIFFALNSLPSSPVGSPGRESEEMEEEFLFNDANVFNNFNGFIDEDGGGFNDEDFGGF